MKDTEERLLDLVESQQTIIDILWAYVDDRDKLEAMAVIAQELKEPIANDND